VRARGDSILRDPLLKPMVFRPSESETPFSVEKTLLWSESTPLSPAFFSPGNLVIPGLTRVGPHPPDGEKCGDFVPPHIFFPYRPASFPPRLPCMNDYFTGAYLVFFFIFSLPRRFSPFEGLFFFFFARSPTICRFFPSWSDLEWSLISLLSPLPPPRRLGVTKRFAVGFFPAPPRPQKTRSCVLFPPPFFFYFLFFFSSFKVCGLRDAACKFRPAPRLFRFLAGLVFSPPSYLHTSNFSFSDW